MKQGTLLFLGDSLLADFNWQERITQFTVINFSIPGETAQGLLNRLPTIQEQVTDPHIILIMTGTNNLLMEDYNFSQTIQQIVISLSRSFPAADVIINSLVPLQIPWLNQGEIKRLNSTMETLSLKSGCCFLDMYGKFSNRNGLFRTDGIHFTETGYNFWARSILEYIAFLLEDD
jgi:lysophospholipase L1-like esterase